MNQNPRPDPAAPPPNPHNLKRDPLKFDPYEFAKRWGFQGASVYAGFDLAKPAAHILTHDFESFPGARYGKWDTEPAIPANEYTLQVDYSGVGDVYGVTLEAPNGDEIDVETVDTGRDMLLKLNSHAKLVAALWNIVGDAPQLLDRLERPAMVEARKLLSEIHAAR